jgi:hypothetical protein
MSKRGCSGWVVESHPFDPLPLSARFMRDRVDNVATGIGEHTSSRPLNNGERVVRSAPIRPPQVMEMPGLWEGMTGHRDGTKDTELDLQQELGERLGQI